MICNDCGNTEAFIHYSTVEEAALFDGDGEFVKVLYADTKDTHGQECHECESMNLSPTNVETCVGCGKKVSTHEESSWEPCAECSGKSSDSGRTGRRGGEEPDSPV